MSTPVVTQARSTQAGSPTIMPAIEASGLEKRYGMITAVDDVSFSVSPGEIFAFLGPNGAGKSTAINMLCTLTRPTKGSARVAGFDVVSQQAAVRAHIGLVFQESTLDKQLTAEENLRFHAVLYGVPRRERAVRVSQMLDLVGLSGRRRDLVSTFSGGMSRRLEIARAMLHMPSVLFLDEPTIGLDPQTRASIWEGIMEMRQNAGLTVFLTTHYMDEADVADRIGIIDHGRIVVMDTPANLKAATGSQTIELHTGDDATALSSLRTAGFTADRNHDRIIISTDNAETHVAGVVAAAGSGVQYLRVHEPTLDDAFLKFTGLAIRDEPSETNSGLPQGWRNRR
jgi:ABC-2 type transport system ATP-binding protein